MSQLRYLGLHINHPTAIDREVGERSYVVVSFSTPSGLVREAPLTEDQLLRLVRDGAGHLVTLREQSS